MPYEQFPLILNPPRAKFFVTFGLEQFTPTVPASKALDTRTAQSTSLVKTAA